MGLPVTKPMPTVLLTRPLAQSKRFAQRLREAGFEGDILISPLLEIEPLSPKLDLAGVQGIIFTSQSAVASVEAHQMPAWCVGEKTADAANRAGWLAKSAGGDADALVSAMCANPDMSGRWVHLRGEHSRGNVSARLNRAGIETTELVVYRQKAKEISPEANVALNGEVTVIVPLFSPRTACFFAEKGPFKAPVHVVAMSEAVRQSLNNLAFERLEIAYAPTAASMLESILSLIDAA